ncbi:MAG TPA: hypothetical protein VFD70_28190 [Anaerolineae bacterium]|nr:hypothetical protein [Anaerolineae bacterium]
MKIQEIQVITYRIPYTVPVKIATGLLGTANNVLVRLMSDDGVVGLGETQPLPPFQGCSETQEPSFRLSATHTLPFSWAEMPPKLSGSWTIWMPSCAAARMR